MYCFAYGSNMSLQRLRARTPSARPLAVATLTGHRLLFHKASRVDGSAKCDAFRTDDPDDRVHGLLFELAAAEKPLLDEFEGLGRGYEEARVPLVTADGRSVRAQMYVATDIDPALRPYNWYRTHVLMGARQHGLPAHYLTRIEAVETWRDPDPVRSARELALYR
ncbi:gamma-glutamylcyclotransferase [Methylonatrum kenyense]|uniref:gamma-glutamylcyclotransferase family protein n=1 Tax=Methylonatrum kenyense TaxID=455253 RepID=UPI0020BDEC56|nr:gamma-glutamylcyclotransferase family protein [Methylonatrum kenyense]MCK8517216.1 gamma-glutamylcyclotransferase [Methylonatrum kenyense]